MSPAVIASIVSAVAAVVSASIGALAARRAASVQVQLTRNGNSDPDSVEPRTTLDRLARLEALVEQVQTQLGAQTEAMRSELREHRGWIARVETRLRLRGEGEPTSTDPDATAGSDDE